MGWFSNLFRRSKKPVVKPVERTEENDKKQWNKDISFRSALAIVFAFEGGYSNDHYDSGGKTKFGIIENEARTWGYKGDMKDLTREFASNIYYRKYWVAHNLDKIAALSPKIAAEIFEMGVNMGSSRGVIAFQRGLNLLNRRGKLYSDIEVDGQMGNGTIRAFKKLPKIDYPVMIKLINAIQGEYYMKFATNNPTQEVFIRGWMKRVEF